MGCVWSRHGSRASLYRVEADASGDQSSPTVFSWDKPGRLDAKDFVFEALKGECRVKPPGSIMGQQFLIENCQDCCFFLFDTMAAVTIDDCSNCRVLIGPVDGSIFLRNCKDCIIVAGCRQFRTRDCFDCSCMLLCGTKPIVESSNKIQFGCFDTGYHGLTAQLQAICLPKFRNFWSDVYDFTPTSESWSFLPQETTCTDLLRPLSHDVTEYLTANTAEAVPKTYGQRASADSQKGFLFVLFPSTEATAATQFTNEAINQGVILLRTNEATLDMQAASGFREVSKWAPAAIAKLETETHIGLEFQGEGCDAIEALAAASKGVFMTSRLLQVAEQFRFAGLG